MSRFFVGDTETANAEDGAGVCEVALIEVNNDLQYIQHYSSKIDPEMPICPSASGVHHITDCDIENEPTLAEYFNIIQLTEISLAAHNVRFDADKLKPVVDIALTLDTLKLAQRYIEGAPDHKLGTLLYYCKLPKPPGELHAALTDSWVCLYLLQHIANITGLYTFKELALESNTPKLVTHITFGKHKGELIADVPNSYLKWCKNNFEYMDIDLEFTINQRLKK